MSPRSAPALGTMLTLYVIPLGSELEEGRHSTSVITPLCRTR